MPIGMFVHVQLCKHISLTVYRTRNDKFVTTDYVKILSSCLMAAYAIT